mmetsp:Transcript_29222/g.76534  ORF Transcript_29222/g.76534 Transcript_29222/m.76534 type:complete len:238 (-) Transcript_29222:830-1543(-)
MGRKEARERGGRHIDAKAAVSYRDAREKGERRPTTADSTVLWRSLAVRILGTSHLMRYLGVKLGSQCRGKVAAPITHLPLPKEAVSAGLPLHCSKPRVLHRSADQRVRHGDLEKRCNPPDLADRVGLEILVTNPEHLPGVDPCLGSPRRHVVRPPPVLEEAVQPRKCPGVERKAALVGIRSVVVRADAGVLRFAGHVNDLRARIQWGGSPSGRETLWRVGLHSQEELPRCVGLEDPR